MACKLIQNDCKILARFLGLNFKQKFQVERLITCTVLKLNQKCSHKLIKIFFSLAKIFRIFFKFR